MPFPYDLREAGYKLPPKPRALCEACWNGPFGVHAPWLFDVSDASQDTRTYSYLNTWDNIWTRSRRSGCDGCRLLAVYYPNFPGTGRANISISVGLRDDRANGFPTGMHMLAINPNVDADPPEWKCYAYVLNDDHPSAPYTKMHAPILDVGSPQAFALARDVIQKCNTEHERCRKIATAPEKTRLPKRLIDCTNPDRPRLVESSEDQCGQYVALSYVWGGDQPHKTTLSILSEYKYGIPLANLPLTIREAIRVTHELGFERLWVDSLCIVQDADQNTKAHEIGRMHHIYRYAALTIAAARARYAGEGFLPNAPPSRTIWGGEAIRVPILCGPTESTAAPKLGTVTLYPEYALPENSPCRQPEPIDDRAWCFQEKLMSPRSLFFTSSSLLFRCQTAAQPVGSSYYEQDPQPRLPDALFLQTPFPPLDQYNSEFIDQSWTMAVKEYTRRLTTMPSDRLVACAAIAQAFHPFLGDLDSPKEDSGYLAGLWRRSLLTNLIWQACDKNARNRRPTVTLPRAPSWSWAAVDGEVNMLGRRDANAVAEVVRCTVLLKNESLPFGEVSGGSLVLRTQLLQLQRIQITGLQLGLQFNPGEQLLRDTRSDNEEDATMDRSNGWYNMTWSAIYEDGSSADTQACLSAWAIPLIINGRDWLHGLIIARVHPDGSDSPDSKTLYRRIGCFMSLRCADSDDNERVLVRPLKNKEVLLQEIEII